jgi:anti-sigma B factor antagonist
VEQELRRVEGQRPLLVVDLHKLRFIDSTGLKLLLSANARAQRDGRRLRVVEGQNAVRRIFHFTGVEKLLDVVPEPAPARAS